jgi:CRP-like cAMP-binding protein
MAHSKNLLLGALVRSDIERLRPHLLVVNLTKGQALMNEGERVTTVYFPFNAIVSLVVGLPNERLVESAMVGRDGVIAASPALDSRLSLTRAVVQVAGASLACDAVEFKKTVLGSPTLLSAMMRHEQTLYAQAQQSTACMSSHSVTPRLCRLLLRARDLCGGNDIPLKQELLADLLGVRRTSVTDAATGLQAAGYIQYTRGIIHISDPDALREASCGCYSVVKLHYEEMIRMKHA